MKKSVIALIVGMILLLGIALVSVNNNSNKIMFGPNSTQTNSTNQTNSSTPSATQISTKSNPTICSSFIRGDANNDKKVDNSDPIYISMYLKGTAKVVCTDALDVNDDEWINANDYYMLSYFLYGSGSAQTPKAPYPAAGTDESCDKIDNDVDGLIDEGCPIQPPPTNGTNQTAPINQTNQTAPINQTNQTAPVQNGTLNATSVPTGASFYLNNVLKGTTPKVITNLAPGTYSFKLVKSGYNVYTGSVSIWGGRTTNINAILMINQTNQTVQKGSLSITSTPSSASIYLSGSYKGSTPKTLTNLAPGTYTLKLIKINYNNYVQSVSVQSGKTTNVNVILTPKSTNQTAQNQTNSTG